MNHSELVFNAYLKKWGNGIVPTENYGEDERFNLAISDDTRTNCYHVAGLLITALEDNNPKKAFAITSTLITTMALWFSTLCTYTEGSDADGINKWIDEMKKEIMLRLEFIEETKRKIESANMLQGPVSRLSAKDKPSC